MRSSGYVLWLSVLLVGIGLSCQADEIDFEHASKSKSDNSAAVESVPDPGEQGSYEGEPEILKKPPPQHYVKYLSTRPITWEVNELAKRNKAFTKGSTTAPQTAIERIKISRNKHNMPVHEHANTRQVLASQVTTLGPMRQMGIVAKSNPGAARTTNTFLSNNRGLVDILLVMDNSGSMYYESTYIMRYFPELMKHIWRSDWRLGVVTSGPGDACTVTTASVEDAANAGKLDFAIDRSSTNYASFHDDLGYTDQRYLDPYFHYLDYKWLSYCRYSNLGYCGSYCSRDDERCMEAGYDHYNSTDYHKAMNDKHKYNPLWGYFKTAITLPKKSSADNGNEQLLRKLRWALEGKTTTGCGGDWARDNATVIAIVVTDEGHSCDDTDYAYCSIDAYKTFVTAFRSRHPFKTYGVLGSKLLSNNKVRMPNWDSDELKAFDGYVINHSSKFEGGYISPQGYFSGLPNGFDSYRPPRRVASSSTRYYNKLNRNYGHRSLHLISTAIAEELRNIYSPLSYLPDNGSATVRVADYVHDRSTSVSEYVYADVSACRAGDTTNQGECYKVVNGAQGSAIELVNFNNMTHFDKKVKVAYTYGGTNINAVPFDTSWTLSYVPDPSTVTVKVTLVGGTINTLSVSDYTLSGNTLQVDENRVQQLVPEGSSITIKYSPPVTLNNSFTLDNQYQLPSGADLVPNSATITIIDADGVSQEPSLTSGFSFNGRVVSFTAGSIPAAGESFSMSYDYWGDIITSYSYQRAANTDTSVELICINENSSSGIDCTYDTTNGRITFTDSSEFGVGNVIKITETLQRPGSGVTISDIDISSYDYAENEEIKITLGEQSCSTIKSSPNQLTVNNGVIELAGVAGAECAIINSLSSNPNQQVTVHYWVYKELPDDLLQMDKSFFAQHKGKYKFEYWEVTVDGNPKRDFMIQDYKITEIGMEENQPRVNMADEEAIRDKFGNNIDIKVTVHLYHAL